MKLIIIVLLQKCKQEKKCFVIIIVYDYSFVKLFVDEGINVLLVGDLLGMMVQGYDFILLVIVEDIVYYICVVCCGVLNSLLFVDLLFMVYVIFEQIFVNVVIVMCVGVNMVKFEGGVWLVDIVRMLVECVVLVCGYFGLMLQLVNVFGGYKVQGCGDVVQILFEDVLVLEVVGVQLLVLECVLVELVKCIIDVLIILVIGIGVGNVIDG